MKKKLGAIILAAGQGKRMDAGDINKVVVKLNGKPMIAHAVELVREAQVTPIVIVVGYQKDSVTGLFSGDIIFAEQKQRLGTADAVSTGLSEVPEGIEDVLILQGDDSAFYKRKTIDNLIKKHSESGAAITMLTIEVDNPTGLGRIVRDTNGNITGVVEEKDATDEQKEISEINPACYVMSVNFLKKYLPQVKKSPVTGEYYLTSLIDIGIKHNEIIETMQAGNIPWRGVNTRDELVQAEDLIRKISS